MSIWDNLWLDAHFKKLKPGLYLILGGAGSGKTTLGKKIGSRFGYEVHSVDSYFIGDGEYRVKFLVNKQTHGVAPLIDASNQASWWDWDRLWSDFMQWATEAKPIFLEGALLGPVAFHPSVKTVFLYHHEPGERLKRILERDAAKRTTAEICARFLITEYSERLYMESISKVIEKKGVPLVWHPSTGRAFLPMEVK
ncbi:nucleotide kinase [Tetrasphaera phage TJE1]|uniref:Nucleotide kinase n=1 Tax=Tetrasphaera phage TJE1 TaxID=981335 RepID=G4W942_9CAUD|nr:guanylate kinase [Tetrasphaera phage TJE1]ADX42530.1 nucleotide kinase [Tetrasphaera phage TJE1]